MSALFGHDGLYHLVVTLPACAAWAVAIMIAANYRHGWRLRWTKKIDR